MDSSQLLFLCTGNYYRSRFAEILFNWQAEQRQLAWRATSRGLAINHLNPGPMSRHTQARLRELGIEFESYLRQPQPVTLGDVLAATRIIAVKGAEHRPLVEQQFPEHLRRFEFWEVHDLDCAGPEVAIPHLEREVTQLVESLANG